MKRITAWLTLAGLLAATACDDCTRPEMGDVEFARAASQEAPGRYIVVFRDNVADPPGLARALARQHRATVRFTYQHTIRGFAARLSEQAADALTRNPNVAYVEPDREAQLFDTQIDPPSWGLDRIDQRTLPLSDSYTYGTTGSGVHVYIFDTGINSSHTDFGGRVQFVDNGAGGDFVDDSWGRLFGAEDCHGHGTHVAGTAAGSSHGVAKDASIYAARVVDCEGGGYESMAIAAVEWVTVNAELPAAVNMSLGYGDAPALRDAVEASIAAGVNYSVAAGNGNSVGIPQDACRESPAGAPNALTVGATQMDDREAPFSNYGPCLDLLAPGVSITSATIGSSTATATMSGTSMSAPHVTGAIALFLEANTTALPAEVAAAITASATEEAIKLHNRSKRNGTPNLLLYVGDGWEPQPPPPPPTDPAPEVNACSPDNAAGGERLTVTVTGDNFQQGATADFGERVSVQSVIHVSAMQLNVAIRVYPRAASGPREVTITNPDGQSGSNVACFSVN